MQDPLASPYPELLTTLDRWFAATDAQYPGVIPCRSGCTACCQGPFDISVADVVMVRDAVRRLPAIVRQGVEERSRRIAEQIRRLEPGWSEPWDIGAIGDDRFDRISETLADVPCPMLDESGGCVIYASRPLICRWMGLGFVAEDGRSIDNGCPIQEEFPAYAALPLQPFALEPFETREAVCLEDAAVALFGDENMSEYETTMAFVLEVRSEK